MCFISGANGRGLASDGERGGDAGWGGDGGNGGNVRHNFVFVVIGLFFIFLSPVQRVEMVD